jgi:two-component system CheB/CheR fusion protein
MCIFARQDIARDPVFSKLDLLSCRNVLIYMGPVLQKRVVSLFHYALNPEGLLFLGTSETIGSFSDLFAPLDKKFKIYSKRSVSSPLNLEYIPDSRSEVEHLQTPIPAASPAPGKTPLQAAVDQLLLNRYVPASVVVDDHMNIVQFKGQTGQFLDPAPGEATLNLLKMVKTGLHLELLDLRLEFQRVKRTGNVRKDRIVIEHNGSFKTVNFEILTIKNVPAKQRYYIVVFEDTAELTPERISKRQKDEKKKVLSRGEAGRLREELEATREYLQSIIEEQRTTNEELRSANEEIQSSNEELQSINEELETAKEELQSTNEELTTVNEELQNRNDELTRVNNDLNNLLSSVNIPIVMLGNDLRVRRFTPLSEKVLNLIPTDIGRPITDIKPNIKVPDLRGVINHVIQTLEISEIAVEDANGKWYSMKVRPYRTMENKIDGAVIVLLEMDSRGRPATQE